jgi:hypothetical protein
MVPTMAPAEGDVVSREHELRAVPKVGDRVFINLEGLDVPSCGAQGRMSAAAS